MVHSFLQRQCTQVLLNDMEQDTDWIMISGSFNPSLLFKIIKKIVLKQSDNQYKSLVVDVAKQEFLAQPFINNSNAKTQSPDAEGVILHGVQRDNSDAFPSSKMRCTHFEACEETYYDWSTAREEVAYQAGVCYHSPDLLQDKTSERKT